MPMSVRYTTVNGRVLCENRGGVETFFMPDTLGNVIETRDMATGVKTSETTYWPYGEVRTQTGTNPSPWGFCGIWGYLQDAAARLYVRARYLRAISSASAFGMFRTQIGASVQFSITVRCGNRLKCWNTMPTSRRTSSMFLRFEVSGTPSTTISPC